MEIGLIFQLLGALITVLYTIFSPSHYRIFNQGWNKKYSWQGWKPIMIISPPSGKKRLKMKLNHTVPKSGILPPRYKGIIIGFLFVLIGLFLQLGIISLN